GIFVEGPQVGVQPVVAAHPRNQGQVGRRSAEPAFRVVGTHADAHVITDPGAGHHQVFHHQLVGDADIIGNPLVTLELGFVATHAVVDEGARTILQSRLVAQVDVDLVQMDAGASGEAGYG